MSDDPIEEFDGEITARRQYTDDERLALKLLCGHVTNEPRRWSHEYLEPGSDLELAARAALVRVLVSKAPLHDDIRDMLAGLFAPPGFRIPVSPGRGRLVQSVLETRELVFKNRGPGIQPGHMRDFEIAYDVAHNLADGVKLEAAIDDAMARFGVKRPTAFRAWEAHGEPWVLKLYAEGRFPGGPPKKVRDLRKRLEANTEALKAIRDHLESTGADPDALKEIRDRLKSIDPDSLK